MSNEFLECSKNDIILVCPICKAERKDEDEWPEGGTHAFTIPYECGTEIDYPIGYDGASYGVKCDGSLKRFEMPDVSKMSEEKKKILREILK